MKPISLNIIGRTLMGTCTKHVPESAPARLLFPVGKEKLTWTQVRKLVPVEVSDAALRYRLMHGVRSLEMLRRKTSRKFRTEAQKLAWAERLRKVNAAKLIRKERSEFFSARRAAHVKL